MTTYSYCNVTKTKKSLHCLAPKFFNLMPSEVRKEKKYTRFITLTNTWLREVDIESLFAVIV